MSQIWFFFPAQIHNKLKEDRFSLIERASLVFSSKDGISLWEQTSSCARLALPLVRQ